MSKKSTAPMFVLPMDPDEFEPESANGLTVDLADGTQRPATDEEAKAWSDMVADKIAAMAFTLPMDPDEFEPESANGLTVDLADGTQRPATDEEAKAWSEMIADRTAVIAGHEGNS